MRSVLVFCGASKGQDPVYAEVARTLDRARTEGGSEPLGQAIQALILDESGRRPLAELADTLAVKDSIIQANAAEIKQLLGYKWDYYKANKKLNQLRVSARLQLFAREPGQQTEQWLRVGRIHANDRIENAPRRFGAAIDGGQDRVVVFGPIRSLFRFGEDAIAAKVNIGLPHRQQRSRRKCRHFTSAEQRRLAQLQLKRLAAIE